MLIVYFIVLFILFTFTEYLDKINLEKYAEKLDLDVTIPALINFILVKSFHNAYEKVVLLLTDQENH